MWRSPAKAFSRSASRILLAASCRMKKWRLLRTTARRSSSWSWSARERLDPEEQVVVREREPARVAREGAGGGGLRAGRGRRSRGPAQLDRRGPAAELVHHAVEDRLLLGADAVEAQPEHEARRAAPGAPTGRWRGDARGWPGGRGAPRR